jgi:predicted ferric reductase
MTLRGQYEKVAPSKFFFTVSHYVHTVSSTTPFAQLTESMFGHPFSMTCRKAQTNIQPSIKPLGKIG